MINSIIDCISRGIYAEFGADYEIYTEKVEQGLKTPCFTILCVDHSIGRFVGERYYRDYTFAVQYYPADDKNQQRECNSITERLFRVLEFVQMSDGPIMSKGVEININDGVLTAVTSYDMYERRAEEIDKMEVLIQREVDKVGGS